MLGQLPRAKSHGGGANNLHRYGNRGYQEDHRKSDRLQGVLTMVQEVAEAHGHHHHADAQKYEGDSEQDLLEVANLGASIDESGCLAEEGPRPRGHDNCLCLAAYDVGAHVRNCARVHGNWKGLARHGALVYFNGTHPSTDAAVAGDSSSSAEHYEIAGH
eukprot:scaffold3061_cov430-Prasinococcus_capsulatus_cf.AAC.6